MAKPSSGSLARLIHARTDLPRPLGLEVTRQHSVTIYLPGLPAFEAWHGALDEAGPVAEALGWRYVAGYLPSGNQRALTTLMVRLRKGTEE